MKTSALHQLYDSLGQLIEQIQLNTDASDSANEIDIYPQHPTEQLVAKSISGNVTEKAKEKMTKQRSMGVINIEDAPQKMHAPAAKTQSTKEDLEGHQ